MEFFPKGWLKLAGIGQFVYQWMASWSGMRHQGAWRDPHGLTCPYNEDDRRCMSIFKGGTIGYVPFPFRVQHRSTFIVKFSCQVSIHLLIFIIIL